MISCLTASLFALSYVTNAQTPPNFTPSTQNGLQVKFPDPGNLNISPGSTYPEADTLYPPAILPPGDSNPQDSYFIIMIDPDIPIAGNVKATGLHWLAQDLKATSPNTNLSTSSPEQSIVAPYKSPNPEYNSGAHRYILYLFKQPANFVFPKSYAYLDPPKKVALRIGFNTTKFIAAAGLGEPVGATYWLEINGTVNGNATELDPNGGGGGGGGGKGLPKGASGIGGLTNATGAANSTGGSYGGPSVTAFTGAGQRLEIQALWVAVIVGICGGLLA